jgi:hypothetical protein
MVLTGKNRSTGRKTCHSATLSIINLTRTDLGSNPGLRGDRPASDRCDSVTELHSYRLYVTT